MDRGRPSPRIVHATHTHRTSPPHRAPILFLLPFVLPTYSQCAAALRWRSRWAANRLLSSPARGRLALPETTSKGRRERKGGESNRISLNNSPIINCPGFPMYYFHTCMRGQLVARAALSVATTLTSSARLLSRRHYSTCTSIITCQWLVVVA